VARADSRAPKAGVHRTKTISVNAVVARSSGGGEADVIIAATDFICCEKSFRGAGCDLPGVCSRVRTCSSDRSEPRGEVPCAGLAGSFVRFEGGLSVSIAVWTDVRTEE
jgi:hypothetical protein